MEASRIAVQLYTLRDFCQTKEALRESLRKVKEIGYQAIQVSGIGPISHEDVKACADEFGLTICATHVSYESMQQELEEVVRQHQLWNCKYVGLGGIPNEYRTGGGYDAFAKEASEIGKRLQEYGLQFIYHNHHFEFQKFEGVTGMERLLQHSDKAAFGFEIDTYWVQAGGANPVDWIYKVDGRMKVIHLKDMAIIDNKQVYAEIGEGNLDFSKIIQACRDTGVEWYIVEQDDCQRDPFESLAISWRNLQQFL
ncbi:sugar phosphate isomerase/epimerase family protein [Paenibacillus sp. GCM10027626]|uniref:sugar phosphate isomerase/epimerase family protein n=1 Tax=Paenibacillus sp. GCM10027626 TaxID=3273411 RepID=UPI0036415DD4